MVTVLIQTESHFPVNRKQIKSAVEKHLVGKVNSNVEVSVTIAGDRQMKLLNSRYRKLDETTDVLSFPQHDPSVPATPFVDPPDDTIHLGDIIVSFPQAILEATEENKLVDDKISDLVLHGLDHLLGIHHEE